MRVVKFFWKDCIGFICNISCHCFKKRNYITLCFMALRCCVICWACKLQRLFKMDTFGSALYMVVQKDCQVSQVNYVTGFYNAPSY